MFFEQKKLMDSEIEQKEVEFGDILVDLEKAAILWKEMRDFFANNSIDDYRFTYWRWFVELTWYRLNVVSKEDIVEVIADQVSSALLQNYNVQEEIMRYLGLRVVDEAEMQGLYFKIQKAFLESDAVVGIWKGNSVTVAELEKEIKAVSKRNDSLEQAEFESKLKQVMFPNDPLVNKYTTADPDEAVRRFIDLVVFFQTFTQEDIWYVVDAFLNPEKYQNIAPGEALSSAAPAAPTALAPKLAPAVQPSSQPATAPKPVAPPQPVVKPTVPTKPTPTQIKSQIEFQFKKEAEGNFVDIEGVMAKLGELAEKNNDPKIAEMMYFDEKENKFVWNV